MKLSNPRSPSVQILAVRILVVLLFSCTLLMINEPSLLGYEQERPTGDDTRLDSPLLSVGASASPAYAQPYTTVSYSVSAANNGNQDGANFQVRFTLPDGVSYRWGSTKVYINDALVSTANPTVKGQTLTFQQANLPARRSDSYFGINTFVQNVCEDETYRSWQLDRAYSLMGWHSYVKQLFHGITPSTTGPEQCWVDFVNDVYDRNMQPVLRLQGNHNGYHWDKPTDIQGMAEAFKRVVEGLPRRDGRRLYIQIWNEPNLNIEWGGQADPVEYGRFLVAVSNAIRSIGDQRIVLLNAPLAPGGNIEPINFNERMLRSVPEALWAWDIYAVHPYPANHPPEYNIHDDTATYSTMTVDSYMPQVEQLAAWGRSGVRIFLSETGYQLWNNSYGWEGYPIIDEWNRADYMVRAFEEQWRGWAEIVGVTPFQLSDPSGEWSKWNWIDGSGRDFGFPRPQYERVRDNVNKNDPFVASKIDIVFESQTNGRNGVHYSIIDAAASNASVEGAGNVAPVTIQYGTSTPSPTPSPTLPPTATPSPTLQPEICDVEPDASEPDDTQWSARSLTWPGMTSAGSLHAADDVDWFVLELPDIGQTRFLRFSAISDEPNAQVRLAVFDESGAFLVNSGVERVITRVPKGNPRLYIRLENGSQDLDCSSYVLTGEELPAMAEEVFIPIVAHPESLYDLAGTISTTAATTSGTGEETRAPLLAPLPVQATSLTVDGDGSIYMAGHGILRLHNPDGSLRAERTLPGQPREILVAGSGLYVSNWATSDLAGDMGVRGQGYGTVGSVQTSSSGVVELRNADTGELRTSISGLIRPSGLALNRAGLWIAETGADQVVLVDPQHGSRIQTIALSGAPYIIQARDEGAYVAAPGANKVAFVSNHGTVEWETELGGLGLPQDIAYSVQQNRLYVLYPLSPRYGQIAVLDGSTGELVDSIEPTLSRPLQNALALELDREAGQLLVSTEQGTERFRLGDLHPLSLISDARLADQFSFTVQPDPDQTDSHIWYIDRSQTDQALRPIPVPAVQPISNHSLLAYPLAVTKRAAYAIGPASPPGQ